MSACQERISDIIGSMFLTPNTQNLRWYGYALSQFDIVEDSSMPSAALAMDSERIVPRIHINPKWALSMSSGELTAVLMHELWHFLNLSSPRQMLRDEDKWNFASDGVINYHIESDMARIGLKRITLPGKPIRLSKKEFSDQEDIYCERVYDLVGSSKSPSLSKQYEKFQAGGITLVDVHDMMKDIEKIPEEDIKEAVRTTIVEATRMAGSAPGEADRILNEMYKSVISWRHLLRHFVGQHQPVGRQPSWKRINRRLPELAQGMTVKRGGRVVILIDVSGSTAGDMPRFWGEAYEISRTNDTLVIQCDMQVCGKPQKLRRGKMPKVGGGGGTDMNPGLKACLKLKPDMIVVFTDGYLFNTPIDTGKPELWVICQNGQQVANKKCITINE